MVPIVVSENMGVSSLTANRINSQQFTASRDHLLFCIHSPCLDDFSILASVHKLVLKGSLLINRDNQTLSEQNYLYFCAIFLSILPKKFITVNLYIDTRGC